MTRHLVTIQTGGHLRPRLEVVALPGLVIELRAFRSWAIFTTICSISLSSEQILQQIC